MKREFIRFDQAQITAKSYNNQAFCNIIRTIGRLSVISVLIFSVTVFSNSRFLRLCFLFSACVPGGGGGGLWAALSDVLEVFLQHL